MRTNGFGDLMIVALCAGACTSTAAGHADSDRVARYQLVCDSSDTPHQSSLFCLRNDTQTGDVKRVAIAEIPVSQGPTAAAPAPSGTYELVCHATRTEDASDLYCVRLHTQTGEMLLVALPKVGIIPEGATPHAHPQENGGDHDDRDHPHAAP